MAQRSLLNKTTKEIGWSWFSVMPRITEIGFRYTLFCTEALRVCVSEWVRTYEPTCRCTVLQPLNNIAGPQTERYRQRLIKTDNDSLKPDYTHAQIGERLSQLLYQSVSLPPRGSKYCRLAREKGQSRPLPAVWHHYESHLAHSSFQISKQIMLET